MTSKYPCGHNPNDKLVPDGSNCVYSHMKGITEFYGIKIVWDEDQDVRVLCWLDYIFPSLRDRIVSVSESKAFLEIELKPHYNSGRLISSESEKDFDMAMFLHGIGATELEPYVTPCGDCWHINIVYAPITNNYQNYINSPEWILKSTRFKRKSHGVCSLCNTVVGVNNLETHHIKYPKNFIDDKKENWIAICKICHKKLHGITEGL